MLVLVGSILLVLGAIGLRLDLKQRRRSRAVGRGGPDDARRDIAQAEAYRRGFDSQPPAGGL